MTRRQSAIAKLLLAALVASVILKTAGLITQQTLDLVLVGSISWTAFGLSSRAGAAPWSSALTAGSVAGALVALHTSHPDLQYMPYLAVAPINLVLSFVFARGLAPGRQPALLVLIEDIGLKPAEDPSFRRFLAGQCALWSIMALATGLVATAAMVVEPMRAALSAALSVLVAVQVLLFFGSHRYAAAWYDRPERWRDTLRAIARVDLWSSLKAR